MKCAAPCYLALLFLAFIVPEAPGQRDAAEPLFPAYKDGKWGYINQTGLVVIPLRFNSAGDFREDFGCVAEPLNGFQTYTFINRRGELLLPPQFNSCRPFSEGRGAFAVETEKTVHGCMDCDPFYHWGYLDSAGKIVIAAQFHSATDFSEGLAAVENDVGKWGFIDKTGRTVIPFRFEYATEFSEGLALVVSHRKYGYIDHAGRSAIRPQFREAFKFSEDVAAVRTSGKFEPPLGMFIEGGKEEKGDDWEHAHWEYIDKTGRAKIRLGAEFVGNFSGGLAAFGIVKSDGYLYCGYLDKTGKPVVPATFGACEEFSDGLGLVLLNGKWHFINSHGDFVLSPPNFQVRSFHQGLAEVSDFCYIDKTGKTIWKPQ